MRRISSSCSSHSFILRPFFLLFFLINIFILLIDVGVGESIQQYERRETVIDFEEEYSTEMEADVMKRLQQHQIPAPPLPSTSATSIVPIKYPVSRYSEEEIWGEEAQIVVISGGEKPRRLEEIRSVIYSLLLTRTCPLHLHIFEDQVNHNHLFLPFWTPLMTHEPKFRISFYNLDEQLNQYCAFADSFYPGSRAKACLDAMLPLEVEKVIALDSDALVFEDFRHFWAEFSNFTAEKSQVVHSTHPLEGLEGPALGHAEEMTDWYQTFPHFAADPKRPGFGINGGIVMIRLDRLRKIGWNNLWKKELLAVNHHLDLGDQDVWNYMYRMNSQFNYIYPNSWNIQMCRPWDQGFCERLRIKKVNIVHGNCGGIWKRYRPWMRAFSLMHPELEEARQVARTYFASQLHIPHSMTEEENKRLAAFVTAQDINGLDHLIRMTSDAAVGFVPPQK